MAEHDHGGAPARAARRDRRLATRLPVRISTIDAETDRWSGRRYFRTSSELSGNLSRGGVFIHTREPLEAGRRLIVELSLPGGREFEAVGRVAWSRRGGTGADAKGWGIGVQFVGGAPEQLAALDAYLARRRPAQRARRREPPAARR